LDSPNHCSLFIYCIHIHILACTLSYDNNFADDSWEEIYYIYINTINTNTTQFKALEDSINIEDITSNDNNRIVLRRIKRNSANSDRQSLYIQNHYHQEGEGCIDYVPEGAHDMGWLGYFVGKNNHLKTLDIGPFTPTSGASVMEVLEPFLKGLNNNKSITKLFLSGINLSDFKIICPFFKNNYNLTSLKVNESTLGYDAWCSLALAIGSSRNKSFSLPYQVTPISFNCASSVAI